MEKPATPPINLSPNRIAEVSVVLPPARKFDSASLLVLYEVSNLDSVPFNPVEGVRTPPSATRRLPLTRVNGPEWRGRFAVDAFRDTDLFGLGPCHWRPVSATAQFVVHGLTFAVSLLMDPNAAAGSSVDAWFSQAAFERTDLNDGNSILGLAMEGADPGEAFPVRLQASIMEETARLA